MLTLKNINTHTPMRCHERRVCSVCGVPSVCLRYLLKFHHWLNKQNDMFAIMTVSMENIGESHNITQKPFRTKTLSACAQPFKTLHDSATVAVGRKSAGSGGDLREEESWVLRKPVL